MKSILFITTNSLATNPRLVKELELARQYFRCTVIYFNFSNWCNSFDAGIHKSFPDVLFKVLSASKENLLLWLISSIVEKIAQFLYPVYKQSLLLSTFSHSKRSFLLWLALKKHHSKYDLVIAHNLAALYPAYSFIKAGKSVFAFDLEDYHPGEAISTDKKNEIYRREFLLKTLLPEAAYVSYASPLIGEAFLKLLGENFKAKHFLVNNSFSVEDFQGTSEPVSKKLALVWFSQNISFGRGLELVVPVLNKYREQVNLTLIGNLNPTFYTSFLKEYNDVLTIKEPMKQKKLHAALKGFDIGLAIELSKADLNREICLTNKIFAYSQAGLYILATDTEAQKLFIQQYPYLGTIVNQTTESFEDALQVVLAKIDEIKQNKKNRMDACVELAWEQEFKKLLDAWRSLN
jgi:glycosyltransferase involved in cell wall biosynthesis